MILLIGGSAIVGVILVGGPSNAFEAVNNIARDVAHEAMALVSAWL